MPIPGRSDIWHMPRIGKIHLGMKQTSDATRDEYPEQTEYFVVKEDDSTSTIAVSNFQAVYGDRPKELRVQFPSDNIDDFFPQWLSAYRARGDIQELFCRGDGTTATRLTEDGKRMTIPCAYEECPLYQEGKCKALAQLQFLLPEVKGIGVWQINTCSFFSTVNVNGTLRMVQSMTGGRIAGIPMTLRLVPKEVAPKGIPTIVYLLALEIDDFSLNDLTDLLPTLAVPKPSDPIPTNEVPHDLYLDKDLVTDADSKPFSGVTEGPPEGSPHVDQTVGLFLKRTVRPKPKTNVSCALVELALEEGGEVVKLITDRPVLLRRMQDMERGAKVRFLAEENGRYSRPELLELHQIS